MDWQKELFDRCQSLNVEPKVDPTENNLTLISSKELTKEEKMELVRIIPERYRITTTIKYEVGPKPTNLNLVGMILQQIGLIVNKPLIKDVTTKHWKITVTAQPHHPEIDWNILNKVLDSDGFFDAWDIELNGQTVSSCYPKLAREIEKNNSIRETVIDPMDAKILIQNCNTVEDFLKL